MRMNRRAIKIAKECFERLRRKRYKRKVRLTFEELLSCFAGDENFSEIGGSLKSPVSCERVRQIYQRFFAAVFPGWPDGRTRGKQIQDKKIKEERKEKREREIKNFSKDGLLKQVAEMAIKNGFSPERIFQNERFLTWALRINGKRCGIYCLENKSAYDSTKKDRGLEIRRYYSHANWASRGIKQNDFLIVLQIISDEEKRVFVIPAEKMMKIFGKSELGRSFYIPFQRVSARRRFRPKFNFFKYENAWYLLRKR